MNHIEIADCAGITLHDLTMLLQGTATATVADQLGVTMADVEAFMNGADNAAMTHRLGLHTMAATVALGTARLASSWGCCSQTDPTYQTRPRPPWGRPGGWEDSDR